MVLVSSPESTSQGLVVSVGHPGCAGGSKKGGPLSADPPGSIALGCADAACALHRVAS